MRRWASARGGTTPALARARSGGRGERRAAGASWRGASRCRCSTAARRCSSRRRRACADPRVGAVKCLHAHVAHALACPGYDLGAACSPRSRPVVRRPALRRARRRRRAGDPREGRRRRSRDQHVPPVPGRGRPRRRARARPRAGRRPRRTVERLTTVVRLGQGVDRTGRLDAAAVARTRDCLAGYAPRLEAFAPERRLLVATSVLRDAVDGREFLEGVERDFALPWRVLAGEEEGALAFRGGTAELAGTGPSPLVLVDIGGGSTEFAVGEPGAAPGFVRSLDVGVVRLTERFLRPTRRRPRSSPSWSASRRPLSRTPCRPLCAAPRAAPSAWPAPTPRSSPTSSACASTAPSSSTGTSSAPPTSTPPSPASARSPTPSAAGCPASSRAART